MGVWGGIVIDGTQHRVGSAHKSALTLEWTPGRRHTFGRRKNEDDAALQRRVQSTLDQMRTAAEAAETIRPPTLKRYRIQRDVAADATEADTRSEEPVNLGAVQAEMAHLCEQLDVLAARESVLIAAAAKAAVSHHPKQLKRAGYHLWLGCCFETIKQVETASVAVIALDPPYGMTFGTGGGGNWNNQWDVRWSKAEWAALRIELWRVLMPGGHIMIFGQGAFSHEVRAVMSQTGVGVQSLVWVHNDRASQTFNQDFLAATGHEDVQVFYRSPGIRALTLFQQGGRGEHSTVLSYEKAPQPRRSMKPVGLMEELIRRYSRPGDTVLDPCMKTGVSGVAARKAGRKFIGIEKEKKHYEAAVKWLREVSQ